MPDYEAKTKILEHIETFPHVFTLNILMKVNKKTLLLIVTHQFKEQKAGRAIISQVSF